MKPQRFVGATIQKVQAKVRAALGDDALIYSIRAYDHGIEILAGLPRDELDDAPQATEIYPDAVDHNATTNNIIENLNSTFKIPKDKIETPSFAMNATDSDYFAATEALDANPNSILRHLHKLGFRGKFCNQFAKDFLLKRKKRDRLAASEIENSLLSRLLTPKDEVFNKRRVCALVGPNGVGKTTSVVKLAKRFINQNPTKKIGFVTSDYCDLASKHQLSYYSEIFNIPLHYANNQNELTIALHELRNMDFVLIDTYGVSQRDKYNLGQLRHFLESQHDQITTLITLPATAQEAVLDEIVRAFMTTNFGGCILTRQDECITMAPLLSVCMHYEIYVNYICSGPNIFRDVEKAEACMLLHNILSESTITKNIIEADLLQNMKRFNPTMTEVSYE